MQSSKLDSSFRAKHTMYICITLHGTWVDQGEKRDKTEIYPGKVVHAISG